MYNRYVRNDNGSYSRIPQEEKQSNIPPSPPQTQKEKGEAEKGTHTKQSASFQSIPPPQEKKSQIKDGLTGILRHVLDQLHLDQVDTGDLLLLILLFFLYREDADEELLVSLGLLLIL